MFKRLFERKDKDNKGKSGDEPKIDTLNTIIDAAVKKAVTPTDPAPVDVDTNPPTTSATTSNEPQINIKMEEKAQSVGELTPINQKTKVVDNKIAIIGISIFVGLFMLSLGLWLLIRAYVNVLKSS